MLFERLGKRVMFMLWRLSQPDFLILDEPTNHIDLEGKERLEDELIRSAATLLITSHAASAHDRRKRQLDAQLVQVRSIDVL
jgi:ATPase subunit of ABC transporter with duplicated ATPase domains